MSIYEFVTVSHISYVGFLSQIATTKYKFVYSTHYVPCWPIKPADPGSPFKPAINGGLNSVKLIYFSKAYSNVSDFKNIKLF